MESGFAQLLFLATLSYFKVQIFISFCSFRKNKFRKKQIIAWPRKLVFPRNLKIFVSGTIKFMKKKKDFSNFLFVLFASSYYFWRLKSPVLSWFPEET